MGLRVRDTEVVGESEVQGLALGLRVSVPHCDCEGLRDCDGDTVPEREARALAEGREQRLGVGEALGLRVPLRDWEGLRVNEGLAL